LRKAIGPWDSDTAPFSSSGSYRSKFPKEEKIMKTWMKPQVREQEVGLEVTSYLPAEIDVI
jgi:coenzyme PQQ precursor peptide PqqA